MVTKSPLELCDKHGLRHAARTLLCFLAGLALLAFPCHAAEPLFAVYLLRSGMTAGAMTKRNLHELELRDEPLFTGSDIVSYSKIDSGLKSTRAACARVRAIPRGTPFVISVGRERIYGGAFWSAISSASFGGAVILQPMQDDDCVFTLALGYPSAKYCSDGNVPLDPRVVQSLEAGQITK